MDEITYRSLVRPKNLVEHINDFDAWLRLAECREDLVGALKAFEEDELYEHCAKIRDYIIERFPLA